MEKIQEIHSLQFEKLKSYDKPLANSIQQNEEDTNARNEKEDISMDAIKMKKMKRQCFKELYNLCNEKFLEKSFFSRKATKIDSNR